MWPLLLLLPCEEEIHHQPTTGRDTQLGNSEQLTAPLPTLSILTVNTFGSSARTQAWDRNKGKLFSASEDPSRWAGQTVSFGFLGFTGSGCKYRPVSLHSSGSHIGTHTGLCLPGLPMTLNKIHESDPHGATVISFNLFFKSSLMSASGIVAPKGNEWVWKFTFY